MLPRAEVAQLSWFQICMAKFDFQSIFMSRESLILLCIIAVEWVFFIINLAVGASRCRVERASMHRLPANHANSFSLSIFS